MKDPTNEIDAIPWGLGIIIVCGITMAILIKFYPEPKEPEKPKLTPVVAGEKAHDTVREFIKGWKKSEPNP